MAESDVIRLPERADVPSTLTITQTSGVRFTPNEIRALKAETGRTMQQLMGPDADDGDRMQTIAWLRLRREGHDVSWEQCGDVELDFQLEQPDPTSSAP